MTALIMPLAIALVVLNLADCVTTWVGVKHYQARELNPFARWLFRRLGLVGAMTAKMVVVVFFALTLAAAGEWAALMGIVYLYCLLIGWNLARLGVHKQRQMRLEARGDRRL